MGKTITRRRFILSLLGLAGSVMAGFGIFDYVRNMKKIYFGGDSGYHNMYKKFGEKYGPFDMTLLEIGAYDKNWKEPVERVMKAAKEVSINLSLPKPGQLLSEKDFIQNSRWWEV